MRRHTLNPRPNWQATVAQTGLTYNTLADGTPYWDESAYWEFTSAEVDRIEAATAEIQSLALAAGDHILDTSTARNRLSEMQIPPEAHARIREAWNSEPPALYGRLDLAYDGRQIKLLEYNADTPTALVEAAVTQWYWLQDRFPQADQFNSIHEKLVAKWKDLHGYVRQPIYFGHDGSEEDFMTVSYLRDTAEQSGLKTHPIAMNDIGWEEAKSRFVDLDRRPIETIFKLYPWEWLLKERFGLQALATMGHGQKDPVQWLEPIWKMLWSNKALLAILWELNPHHELLLPAYLDGPRNLKDYVKKPLFGREGKEVRVFHNWVEDSLPEPHPAEVRGVAQSEVYVYQKLAALAEADGNITVIGSWLIDGEPAGMGIRESKGLVTTNTSRFVPHLFQ